MAFSIKEPLMRFRSPASLLGKGSIEVAFIKRQLPASFSRQCCRCRSRSPLICARSTRLSVGGWGSTVVPATENLDTRDAEQSTRRRARDEGQLSHGLSIEAKTAVCYTPMMGSHREESRKSLNPTTLKGSAGLLTAESPFATGLHMFRSSGDGIAWLAWQACYPAALFDVMPGMQEKASRDHSMHDAVFSALHWAENCAASRGLALARWKSSWRRAIEA
ncbi:hypothetical protein BO71DRAFT_426375 [Aspergillus ellipticus CBS 707.79]|uniref:Uncharacterized protein n=1 Tax=Aspergillus ellipticus CBS 707.79 TaxID=1448320 RepID=A0A319F125_9EURO|nr:hypothetical protein BO71DRAFT_426375 [Aspergillus ellipticus CBS 707.79]